MIKKQQYPQIKLRSKNELAKRISDRKFPYKEALALINDVLVNKDKYWYDSKRSQPEKEKYVRSAQGTALGLLLKLIDKKILKPYDNLLPEFIFGGISGSDHVRAAQYLLGTRRKRVLLSADMKKFFEQIKKERVFHFFYNKCGCGQRGARILAEICCVQQGPKGSGVAQMVVARGFATSVRLAVWTNVEVFLKVFWTAKKALHNKDCRIAVFVDDIGICASEVEPQIFESLYSKIENIFNTYDPGQPLLLNNSKKKIQGYKSGIEHLGLKLEKNKISIGGKTRAKIDRIREQILQGNQSQKLKQTKRGLISYKKYVRSVSVSH